MLMKFHHFVGVADISVGELGDMDKPVMVYANVYKHAEIGDVCDYAR